jgi:FkbM family methyltransferase
MLRDMTLPDAGTPQMPAALALSRRAIAVARAVGADGTADRLTYWLNELLGARVRRARAAVPMKNGTVAVIPLRNHDLRTVALTGIYEPDVAAFARAVVRPGDTVVDVGAHIGLHTLDLASLVGPKGIVYAFEPDYRLADLLSAGLRLSGCDDRVTLHEAVVGNVDGTAQLFVDREAGLTNSTLSDWAESGETRTVRAMTLDRVLFPVIDRPVGLLKIDAEGAEEAVLDGAEQLLAALPPRAIVVEVSSRVDAARVLARLERHGYRVSADEHVPAYTEASYGERDFAYANLCVVRGGVAVDPGRPDLAHHGPMRSSPDDKKAARADEPTVSPQRDRLSSWRIFLN